MANTTAMARGVKRYFAGPVRNTTGTKTMQIDSVETNAGVAICWAPSRIAWTRRLPSPRFRWMFSISTVASSTRMPTARASPPSVMTLSVWPIALRIASDVRIESGIDVITTSVLRQLPRKRRIMRPLCQERLWVEIDHDLPRLAAVRQGQRDALNRRDLLADAIDPVVVELSLRERLAAEGELDDRYARGVELKDEGRDRARRHPTKDGLRHRGHLRERRFDIHVRLEIDLDDSDARIRLRLDRSHIADHRRDRVLGEGRDPRRHVLGGQTVVVPDHRDPRDVDLGKDVRRRGDDRGDAKQHDGEPHDDESVGAAKRQPNDPHVAGLPPCSVDADESDGDSRDRARVLALMLRKRAARNGFLSGVY